VIAFGAVRSGETPLLREPRTKPGLEGTTTILIVEDDCGTRDALCEILDAAGYSVLAAENGLRAFESVTEAGVTTALILLDLAMPVMDGFTFLSKLDQHARLCRVPVIVMSSETETARMRVAQRANVFEVLPKPLNLRHMRDLVRKHAGPTIDQKQQTSSVVA
jgi:CheY-like chemotaxis protein